jgi:hypothetical protein
LRSFPRQAAPSNRREAGIHEIGDLMALPGATASRSRETAPASDIVFGNNLSRMSFRWPAYALDKRIASNP